MDKTQNLNETNQHGLKTIAYDNQTKSFPEIANLVQRDLLTGGVDFDRMLSTISAKEPFSVMSGIKPSGAYHFGSLLTVQEIIAFQKLGGTAFFCLADMEAYLDSSLPFEKAKKIAVDNIADVLALGFNVERSYIYFQSVEQRVQHNALLFSKFVTLNTLQAIYGKKRSIAYYNSALILVADILLPQIIDGPIPTITPVGMDQLNHARLTRDIVRKAYPEFTLPSFMFHSMIKGLDGSEKMSKSKPFSFFRLDDPEQNIIKVIDNALTGGKDTAKEQKLYGGNPKDCRIFDLFRIGVETDYQMLKKRELDCSSGELLCGPCKSDLKNQIITLRNEHLDKKKYFKEFSIKIVKEAAKL
jgi:tryptophanyl-tRNA synthetase